jgi:hypothetical protein
MKKRMGAIYTRTYGIKNINNEQGRLMHEARYATVLALKSALLLLIRKSD